MAKKDSLMEERKENGKLGKMKKTFGKMNGFARKASSGKMEHHMGKK